MNVSLAKARLTGATLASTILVGCGAPAPELVTAQSAPQTPAAFFFALGTDQPLTAGANSNLLTLAELQAADTDRDGTVSQAEMTAYLESQQTSLINDATLPGLGWDPISGLITAVAAGYAALAGAKIANDEMHPSRNDMPDPAPTAAGADPIVSDGLQLAYTYTPAATLTTKAVLLCHDFGSSKTAMAEYADFLGRYNVLAVDLRNHGASQGTKTTGGLGESHDVLAAVDFLKRHGNDSVGALGLGLGAVAAIDAASGNPSALRGIVSDGAYASLQSELSWRAKARHLPWSDLVGAGAAKIIQVATCLPLDQGNAATMVGHVGIPIFFIQGKNDTTVAPDSARQLWQAASPYRQGPWIVTGAGAGGSHQVDKMDYEGQVLEFFAHAL